MDKVKNRAIIEAVLFSMGETVEIDRLTAVLEVKKEELIQLMDELIQEYENENRGIRIIRIGNGYQMCTSRETYEYLIKLVKIPRSYKLTDVQLETLSIIAYKQPITKIEIERIRGVQSDYAVNRLVEVGLVEETGRLEQPGRPLLFGTTEEFLRRFGLQNTQELPDINAEKVELFKMEAEQELGYIDDNDSNRGNIEDSKTLIVENKEKE